MKKFTILLCLLFAYASGIENDFMGVKSCACKCSGTQIGSASYSGKSKNAYPVTTHGFPDSVPLSLNRNAGSKQGDVKLTDEGIKLMCPGNYSVSFSTILINKDTEYAPVFQVFLVENGIFVPNSPSNPGNIVSLDMAPAAGKSTKGPVQFTGILENVRPGTTLSLVITNGGSPDPQLAYVESWEITAFRIEC